MRTIFILFLFSIATSFLVAQSHFSFGINAQLGLSGEINGIEEQSQSRGSFNYAEERNPLVPVMGAGGWVAYIANDKVRFQAGLQYVNSGHVDFSRTYSGLVSTGQRTSGYYYEYRFRAHQIQLPFEIQLSIGRGKLRPFVSFGTQLTRDWIGNIYGESPLFIGNEVRTQIRTWSPNKRNEVDTHHLGIQPVFGFGIRLNDQLSVRLRHTWMGREQQIEWYEELEHLQGIVPNPTFGWYGTISNHRTASIHRQVTSLEFSYVIF
ncbi:MAG: outer membrane beta-barrel protein [Bacteroidota bacterium]